MRNARNWWRIGLLGLAFGGVGWVILRSQGVLTPFIIGAIIAFVLMPLVDALNKFLPRIIAILLVYVVIVGGLIGFTVYLVPIIAEQASKLTQNFPTYINSTQKWIDQTLNDLKNAVPKEFLEPLNNALSNLSGTILNFFKDIFGSTFTTIITVAFGTVNVIVGVFIIPFWLFFVLKDKALGLRTLYSTVPVPLREDTQRLLRIIAFSLNGYIKGQLLLAASVAIMTTSGLLILGFPAASAIFLGFIAGFFEILPIIGPFLGAIPYLITAFFTDGGGLDLAVKAAIVGIIVQQIEGNVLVPKIAGDSTKIHPAIVMILLIIGADLGGLGGAIVVVPLAAVIRDVYVYTYQRAVLQASPDEAEAKTPGRRDDIAAELRRSELRQLKNPQALASKTRANPNATTPAESTAEKLSTK